MTDGASLQYLNDIVVPAPITWWPLAPGWYLLAFFLLAMLGFLAYRQWRRWRQNGYRRQALRELSFLREDGTAGSLRQLPILLKRAALSLWPREAVASLTGATWHRFLDETAGTDRFCSGAGETLELLAYAGHDVPELPQKEIAQLIEATEFWLKHHRQHQVSG